MKVLPVRRAVLILIAGLSCYCRPQIRPQHETLPSSRRLAPQKPPLEKKPSGEIKATATTEPFLLGLFPSPPGKEEMEMATRVVQLNRSSAGPAADTAWDPFLETAYAYLEQPAAKLNLGTLVRVRVAAEFELDAETRRGKPPAALTDAVAALIGRIDQKIEILRGLRRRGQNQPSAADPARPCWPLSYGLVTSGFGMRRDPLEPGEEHFHAGLDLAAAPREPVLSILPGVVEAAGWAGSYGRLVRIRHAAGLESIYAHLELILVKTGQRVGRAETIGLMGNSGRSTGYHLHFEVRRDGKPVDPMSFLPQITFSYSDQLPGVSFEISPE
jgi:murein DD-endopeptidase MepM/ murein hydrolase activator NlpD